MKQKRGITIAVLVATVAIMAILATATITSIANSYANSRLSIWISEIELVQDLVNENKDNLENILVEGVDYDVTKMDIAILNEQFKGETILNGKIDLKIINLPSIGLDNSTFGKRKEEFDVYVYSEETGKVYYLKGIDVRTHVYYSLTAELQNRYEDNLTTSKLSLISFEQSEIKTTETPIRVTVKVPKIYTDIAVTTSNEQITIGNQVVNENMYTYTVNTNSVKGNYTITVKYKDNGEDKTVAHQVKNFQTTLGSLVTAADYGKTINYVADNGLADWKVFYHTDDYVYLIASEKLAYNFVPTKLTETVANGGAGAKIKSNTLTLADNTTRTVGQIYWVSGGAPSTAATIKNSSTWMANWTNYSTNENGRCVSYFLDEIYWTAFKNTEKYKKTNGESYVQGAIGTPTLEMFVASWNAKRLAETNTSKILLTLSKNGTVGYYVNDSTSAEISTSDLLYTWSTVSDSSMWLASPAGEDTNYLFYVSRGGYVSYSEYLYSYNGLRPVVCLSADIPANVDATGNFVI